METEGLGAAITNVAASPFTGAFPIRAHMAGAGAAPEAATTAWARRAS